MKRIFTHPEEGRARMGWRVLIFIVLFWIFSAIIFAVRPLLGDVSRSEFLSQYSWLIVGILAFGATLATFLARRFLDKRSFKSLGLHWNRKSWQDLLFGFALSAGMAGLFFAIALGTGSVELQGLNPLAGGTETGQAFDYSRFISTFSLGVLFLFLLEHILVGYWEELVFRGYLFQNFVEGMGLTIAVIVSCIIYGLIHAANPNAGILSSSIIVLFGFLRIYGYLSTKTLWLSMGMHIGWNFFQGPIFGFGASGHQHAYWIRQEAVGPDWLSGGEFGPEASILIIPIIGLALLTMRWWTRNRLAEA